MISLDLVVVFPTIATPLTSTALTRMTMSLPLKERVQSSVIIVRQLDEFSSRITNFGDLAWASFGDFNIILILGNFAGAGSLAVALCALFLDVLLLNFLLLSRDLLRSVSPNLKGTRDGLVFTFWLRM